MSLDTDSRIARLERQNRYLLIFVAIAFLLSAGTLVFLLMAKGRTMEGTISASTFQVTDSQGRKRATLGLTDKNEPFLALASADSNREILIAIHPGGPPYMVLGNVNTYQSLALYGPGGDWAAGINLTHDTKHLGELYVNKDGVPGFTLRDKDGKTLWKAP